MKDLALVGTFKVTVREFPEIHRPGDKKENDEDERHQFDDCKSSLFHYCFLSIQKFRFLYNAALVLPLPVETFSYNLLLIQKTDLL